MAIRPAPRAWDPTHTSNAKELLASGRIRPDRLPRVALPRQPCWPCRASRMPLLQLGPLVGDRRRRDGRGDPVARLAYLVQYSRHRHAGGHFVATLHPDDAPDAPVDLPRERSRWRLLLVVDASLRSAGLTQSARRLVMAGPVMS